MRDASCTGSDHACCGMAGDKSLTLFTEGSLEVKLPTIWTEGKAEVGRVREENQEVRSEKRKSEKKEDAGAQKGRKVTIHCVFPMICGSGWSKVGLLKRRVQSHLAR